MIKKIKIFVKTAQNYSLEMNLPSTQGHWFILMVCDLWSGFIRLQVDLLLLLNHQKVEPLSGARKKNFSMTNIDETFVHYMDQFRTQIWTGMRNNRGELTMRIVFFLFAVFMGVKLSSKTCLQNEGVLQSSKN